MNFRCFLVHVNQTTGKEDINLCFVYFEEKHFQCFFPGIQWSILEFPIIWYKTVDRLCSLVGAISWPIHPKNVDFLLTTLKTLIF